MPYIAQFSTKEIIWALVWMCKTKNSPQPSFPTVCTTNKSHTTPNVMNDCKWTINKCLCSLYSFSTYFDSYHVQLMQYNHHYHLLLELTRWLFQVQVGIFLLIWHACFVIHLTPNFDWLKISAYFDSNVTLYRHAMNNNLDKWAL